MNLRSSVVTAIYNKALVISVASLSRKTLGEITNLMSVDSSRLQVSSLKASGTSLLSCILRFYTLFYFIFFAMVCLRFQDLTPYLHAVWYSLYQIAVALFFLYRQMGVSCFAGNIYCAMYFKFIWYYIVYENILIIYFVAVLVFFCRHGVDHIHDSADRAGVHVSENLAEGPLHRAR